MRVPLILRYCRIGMLWKDMEFENEKKVWTAEIEFDANASHIDFFSNHGRTLHYNSRDYRTCLSSPIHACIS